MPNYVLLLHESGSFPPDMSPADMQAIIQRYIAWRQRVQSGGRKVDGHKLVDGEGRIMRGKPGSSTVPTAPTRRREK